MTAEQAKKEIKENFAQQLLDCMELADMNVSDLARAVGMGHSTINNYLKRSCIPSAEKALAIADALGVTVEMLLTGKER